MKGKNESKTHCNYRPCDDQGLFPVGSVQLVKNSLDFVLKATTSRQSENLPTCCCVVYMRQKVVSQLVSNGFQSSTWQPVLDMTRAYKAALKTPSFKYHRLFGMFFLVPVLTVG